jgi:hypothetical protein
MMKRTAIALFGIILSLALSMGPAWGELQTTETFYGLYAGFWYSSGTYNNTFIGNSAGNDNTSGESNVFIDTARKPQVFKPGDEWSPGAKQ